MDHPVYVDQSQLNDCEGERCAHVTVHNKNIHTGNKSHKVNQ